MKAESKKGKRPMSEDQKDIVNAWIQGIERETTQETYGYAIKKLLAAMKMTGEEVLEAAREDPARLWNAAKDTTTKFPSSGRHKALNALRTFLRSYGVYPPWDRLGFPPRKKSVGVTWKEAQSIVEAAESPYRYIFNLMLHCGWGVQQFLLFNTAQNWDWVQNFLAKNSEAKYCRLNLESRKSNPQPFYSLIPAKVPHEILEAKISVPFRTKRNAELSMANYKSSRNTLATAFREAVSRTSILNKDRIKPHELRDTFKSAGTTSGTALEAKKFAMGHTIDPDHYDKCWNDESWMWKELSKIYHEKEPEVTAKQVSS